MATSEAGGAAPRVAGRVVRAAKVLVLAVGVYGCFLQLPCAAAVLRVAASLSAQRYLFLVGNAIVIVLFEHFRRDGEASSFSTGDFLSRWWPAEADAQGRYLPFPGAHLVPPPSPTTEAWGKEKEKEKAVHVTAVRAKPPRRSRSEKAGGGASGRRPAAAPELRRGDSENGRQRQQAVAVAEAEADPEAFRLWIEAFILKKQQDFLREESAAAAAAAACGKKGAPMAAGAVVAVK